MKNPLEKELSGAGEHRQRSGRPLVTLSYAQSLDGSITDVRGSRLALSGPETLKLTHQLRASHEAILVGIGTVLADDPHLTARLEGGERQPQPVVLDSHLRTPLEAGLMSHPKKPWIVTVEDNEDDKVKALEALGARVMMLSPDGKGRPALGKVLDRLGQEGVDSLMVEGGARVITSFLHQELADLLLVTITPVLLGGQRAVEELLLFQGPGEPKRWLPRLEAMQVKKMGEDLVVWGRLTRGAA